MAHKTVFVCSRNSDDKLTIGTDSPNEIWFCITGAEGLSGEVLVDDRNALEGLRDQLTDWLDCGRDE